MGENSVDTDVEGVSTSTCDDVGVDAVGIETLAELSDAVRLLFDGDRRIVGVSNDSRAFGSSSDVYFPMAGRWYTY